MAEYIMLLHESPTDFADLSAEDIQQVIGEYIAWRKTVEADGKMAGGQKLKDDGGKNLTFQNGRLRVTDGPFAEAKEVIGGYFSILADNYNEAVKTAQTCPHLKYGGRIELREVEPTN